MHLRPAARLTQRIANQIELKGSKWKRLSPIHHEVELPTVSEKIRLFYSYSHVDEELRDELEKHLAILKRQGLIDQWNFRQISGGQEWDHMIDEHLESAHIILLLISADFLNSDYCHDVEMKRAMERHEEGTARVIPVILRACPWKEALFAKLQAYPKDAKPVKSWNNIDEAFADVANGISKVVHELRGTT